MLDTLVRDLGYAWRLWSRRPGFTALALFALALGMALARRSSV